MKHLTSVCLLLVLAAGCSSDDGNGLTTPGTGSGSMAARVDGATWTARSITASYLGGMLSLSGTDGTYTISLAATVQGPAVQDLTEGTGFGAIAEGASTWYAVGEGGTGTMSISALTSSGATGTFSFTAGPLPGGTGGTRSITSGTFDVRF